MSARRAGRLGPAEVAELYTVWWDGVRRDDYRAGVLATIASNKDRGPSHGPRHEPWTFFPSLAHLRPAPMSEGEIFSVMSRMVESTKGP